MIIAKRKMAMTSGARLAVNGGRGLSTITLRLTFWFVGIFVADFDNHREQDETNNQTGKEPNRN